MHFAHLKPQSTGTDRTLLVPSNPVDSTALLKARTLLAFLDDAELLVRIPRGAWVMYTRTPDTVPDSFEWDAGDNIANIPYAMRSDIRHQPGTALIRNTFEATTLFQKVYLRSSIDWLHTRPSLHQELKSIFCQDKSHAALSVR